MEWRKLRVRRAKPAQTKQKCGFCKVLQPSCGVADFIFLPSPDAETEGLLEFMAEHNRCGVRSSVTFTAPGVSPS